MNEFEGVIPIWKPAGMTSHDVVAKVRRIISMKRVGHTGTLDPQVTGVLPICIGRATRVVEYMQQLPKQYEAEMMFGIETDTQDLSGEVINSVSKVELSLEKVEQALAHFSGVIEQVPPMYSALKVNGKKLYELAREGKTVERKAREVTIHRCDLIHHQLHADHPKISLRVDCSKGTYIRTLCYDIGKKLGLPAVMTKLVRTVSCNITANEAITLEQLAEQVENEDWNHSLIPTDKAIKHIPAYHINNQYERKALQGQKIPLHAVHKGDPTKDVDEDTLCIRLYGSEKFLGIYERRSNEQLIVPVKVFS
ncbi:tRNA pseudouridine(55) synthase TruB [Longirhabdus pacifica]|uniref:tRNA pseudouridine(55) synthase TruB n=1 Tax=Longirhabdus pacifica TaxID=2305227 RepID=UPI0010088C1D|nr:tRNA pseudouridine(55) synthase TruB [Longirhabdus pacifica]